MFVSKTQYDTNFEDENAVTCMNVTFNSNAGELGRISVL